MSIFLDTSVLLKLYLPEPNSQQYELLIDQGDGVIFLSTLTRIEFASAALKKVRVGALASADAQWAISHFALDAAKYQWIPLTAGLLANAERLIHRHMQAGLRTLDAIQLAAALEVQYEADLFLTADTRLAAIFQAEGLSIE